MSLFVIIAASIIALITLTGFRYRHVILFRVKPTVARYNAIIGHFINNGDSLKRVTRFLGTRYRKREPDPEKFSQFMRDLPFPNAAELERRMADVDLLLEYELERRPGEYISLLQFSNQKVVNLVKPIGTN